MLMGNITETMINITEEEKKIAIDVMLPDERMVIHEPQKKEKRARRSFVPPVYKEGSMTIDDYLFENRMSMKELAMRIDYGLGYLCQCNSGSIKMSARMKYLISKTTKGKVRLE